MNIFRILSEKESRARSAGKTCLEAEEFARLRGQVEAINRVEAVIHFTLDGIGEINHNFADVAAAIDEQSVATHTISDQANQLVTAVDAIMNKSLGRR